MSETIRCFGVLVVAVAIQAPDTVPCKRKSFNQMKTCMIFLLVLTIYLLSWEAVLSDEAATSDGPRVDGSMLTNKMKEESRGGNENSLDKREDEENTQPEKQRVWGSPTKGQDSSSSNEKVNDTFDESVPATKSSPAPVSFVSVKDEVPADEQGDTHIEDDLFEEDENNLGFEGHDDDDATGRYLIFGAETES